MITKSLYLYNKHTAGYFIVTEEALFTPFLDNPSYLQLTKEEYFEATLPDWGIDIINSLK